MKKSQQHLLLLLWGYTWLCARLGIWFWTFLRKCFIVYFIPSFVSDVHFYFFIYMAYFGVYFHLHQCARWCWYVTRLYQLVFLEGVTTYHVFVSFSCSFFSCYKAPLCLPDVCFLAWLTWNFMYGVAFAEGLTYLSNMASWPQLQ